MIGIGADEKWSWMAWVYQWGIDCIKGIQRIENPLLTELIKGITALGSEYFYIPVVLFMFWCIDERQGLRLGLLIILSSWVNGGCKELLRQPRPYSLDPSVGRAFEPSYGIPSGHAQLSLTFWAWVSGFWRERLWSAAILIILVIGFTRLYLGLHFPTDLLAGWFLGGLILLLYYGFGKRIEARLAAGGTRVRIWSVALVALIMNASGSGRIFGGLMLGFGMGYSLMLQHVPFSAQAMVRGKKPALPLLAARYALGITGAVLVYQGLKAIFPGEGSLFAEIPGWGANSPYYELGCFVRYGLAGCWVTLGAPWLFLRLGLASGRMTTLEKGEH
ncbi:MAG: phosphatase PAP2 family protein [Treponema sp.]|jgi:membrane-associated phospholipid phosphatase|nr:phosphatase PAP2 family protein [Treponema sp.]